MLSRATDHRSSVSGAIDTTSRVARVLLSISLKRDPSPNRIWRPSFNQMGDEIQKAFLEIQRQATVNKELFMGSIRMLANAIDDACGVRIMEMPLNAEAVYRALRAKMGKPLEDE